MPPRQIDISTLEPKQLQLLATQLEEELQELARSSMALQKAAGEFGSTGQAIEQLAMQKEGQPTMLPLTSAVYVSGKLASPESVLVDIGTGYFAEKRTEQGIDYCRRRVGMLRDNLNQIGAIMQQKQGNLTKVRQVLASRQVEGSAS